MRLSANLQKILLLIGFSLIFLAVRLPSLGIDSINPDGVNWYFRSEQFVVGLKQLDLAKTYQHYHPGVTLMWIVGPTIELVKQVFPDEAVINHVNFVVYHRVVKFVLVMVQLVVSLVIVYVVGKVFAFEKRKNPAFLSFCVAALLSLEPFFLGNSRLLHMDVLFSLILFAGLTFTYLGIQTKYQRFTIAAGVFLGLAFLTKSVGIGGFVFALIVGSAIVFINSGKKRALAFAGVLVPAFIATTILVFPAMLVDPINTLLTIFNEAERVGGRKGHEQIFFGQHTENPGVLFYPFVFLLKVSPFSLFGIILWKFNAFKTLLKSSNIVNTLKDRALVSYPMFLGIFYLGYIFVMILPTKKLDRYMLPVYPFIALIAVLAYFDLITKIKWNIKSYVISGVLAAFGVLVVMPVMKFHPYQFTYTSPLSGSAVNAHKIIAQKPFGIGIFELKQIILDNYGYYPKLGFFDTKPIEAIYPNSRVFDIRISGVGSYDLIILGPDEEMPENILESDTNFKHDRSLFINGLEYWRVYVKEDFKTYVR